MLEYSMGKTEEHYCYLIIREERDVLIQEESIIIFTSNFIKTIEE